MGTFVAGDVVVTKFPFSDLMASKKRPAVVLALGDFGDPILCQITSFRDDSLNTVAIRSSSFVSGNLPVSSFARPDKLFTADASIITKTVGHLSDDTMTQLKHKLTELFGL